MKALVKEGVQVRPAADRIARVGVQTFPPDAKAVKETTLHLTVYGAEPRSTHDTPKLQADFAGRLRKLYQRSLTPGQKKYERVI